MKNLRQRHIDLKIKTIFLHQQFRSIEIIFLTLKFSRHYFYFHISLREKYFLSFYINPQSLSLEFFNTEYKNSGDITINIRTAWMLLSYISYSVSANFG